MASTFIFYSANNEHVSVAQASDCQTVPAVSGMCEISSRSEIA